MCLDAVLQRERVRRCMWSSPSLNAAKYTVVEQSCAASDAVSEKLLVRSEAKLGEPRARVPPSPATDSPSSPSNCSMASTALSCVLWWRWLGILVMFHGIEWHSGIRTGSHDAARTAAARHRAQHTAASSGTDTPGGRSMAAGRAWAEGR